jgi:hypothetical protein
VPYRPAAGHGCRALRRRIATPPGALDPGIAPPLAIEAAPADGLPVAPLTDGRRAWVMEPIGKDRQLLLLRPMLESQSGKAGTKRFIIGIAGLFSCCCRASPNAVKLRTILRAGETPAFVRPTAHHISRVKVPTQAEALRPGIRPRLRRREAGWRAGGGERTARRRTNVIRRDGAASQRTTAKPTPFGGTATMTSGLPMKAWSRSVAWLTTGRLDGVERGLGTPAWISARATGSCRDQGCHSSEEGGESRWSEGHQEGGCADAA